MTTGQKFKVSTNSAFKPYVKPAIKIPQECKVMKIVMYKGKIKIVNF